MGIVYTKKYHTIKNNTINLERESYEEDGMSVIDIFVPQRAQYSGVDSTLGWDRIDSQRNECQVQPPGTGHHR